MSTAKSQPLRVAAIGLDEKMNNALRMFFQGPCHNACILVPEDSAELSIVDLDGYDGTQQLEKQRKQFPQRPVIVLSLCQKEVDDTILLRKPVKPTLLFEAIDKAKEQLYQATEKSARKGLLEDQKYPSIPITESVINTPFKNILSIERSASDTESQSTKSGRSTPSTHRAAMYLDERSACAYIGSARDIDPADRQQVAKAQYDPNSFFQSYLKQAVSTAERQDCHIAIECPQGSITVAPKSQSASMNISAQRLRTLSSVPVAEGTMSLSPVKHIEQSAEPKDNRVVELDELIWRTTLWASRGRVPTGTSLVTPVVMRRWPNLTRLTVIPNALRIAALWGKAPYPLLETAKFLGIPQRNVFAFYSAAHAIGLVELVAGDSVGTRDPESAITKERAGLLIRMLNRLRWR